MAGQPSIKLSRRRLLRLSAALPFGALYLACSSDSPAAPSGVTIDSVEEIISPPQPTATPEPPFIVAEGEQRRSLMGGTAQETPLHIFGSGRPGNVVTVLGGVHGNEPGGWLAAERIAETLRPQRGALIVLPRANRLAINSLVRTTDALGDLNRLYPGDPNGLPMARMAAEIVDVLREFRVSYVLDLHESWAFYKDRPQNGTAYLGQTVATYPAEPGISLAQGVVASVNGRIRAAHEELFYREFPSNRLPEPTSARPLDTSGNPEAAVSGGSASSLGLPRHIPGLAVLLVEMGQQQTLERRIAMHVDVVGEASRRIGLIDA